MNKISIQSAFSILILSAFFVNCKNEPGAGKESGFHFTMADSLLNQYNRKHSAYEKSVRYEGGVNIVLGENLITIQQDTHSAKEAITFFLHTKMKYPELKSGPFGHAEIIYLDRNLIVNSLESPKSMFFSVYEEPDPGYLKDLNNVEIYQGFGLGYRKVTRDNPSEIAPYCSCEEISGPVMQCSSGGEGALSCSRGNLGGSCRVSCSPQAYLCCDKVIE